MADDSSDGTWNITGDVGNITIADDLGESLAWNISGNVGHIKVGGDLSGVVWHVSGDVKGLRVGDDLQDIQQLDAVDPACLRGTILEPDL